jgi:uncharacterized protein YqhQ
MGLRMTGSDSPPLRNYGGQAVIEGVMMRGSVACAVAARAPDRRIVIEHQPLGRLYRSRLARLPFLRGTLLLWDALVLGIRALTFSANVQTGEDQKLEGAPLTITLALSLILGIGVFFLLPAGVVYLAEAYIGLPGAWHGLSEGVVRLALMVGYIWGVGRIPDVERVFAYHGAEHKTINAYEAGAPIDVDTVAGFPREHTRCGTSFLLTVVVVSVLIFSAVGPLPLLARLASRILLIPVIAGLAYEYIRWTGRIRSPQLARMLAGPNLALQRLTTREPERDMIEVAIAAFKAMKEKETETEPASGAPAPS